MRNLNIKLSVVIEASKELIDTTDDEKDLMETQKENIPGNILQTDHKIIDELNHILFETKNNLNVGNNSEEETKEEAKNSKLELIENTKQNTTPESANKVEPKRKSQLPNLGLIIEIPDTEYGQDKNDINVDLSDEES